MSQSFLNEFLEYLDAEDKEKCVDFIIKKLDNKEIEVSTLYSQVLEPALNKFYCDVEEEKLCIWKEHVRNSIISTIIEICYSYILKERKDKGIKALNIKVLVGCPSEEYCDMGAKMISDIFTLYGFDSVFIGANTPRTEIRDAINILNAQKGIQKYIFRIAIKNDYKKFFTFCYIFRYLPFFTKYTKVRT